MLFLVLFHSMSTAAVPSTIFSCLQSIDGCVALSASEQAEQVGAMLTHISHALIFAHTYIHV